jgi:hypothetical protein
MVLTLQFPKERNSGNPEFGWKISKIWSKIVPVRIKTRALPIDKG